MDSHISGNNRNIIGVWRTFEPFASVTQNSGFNPYFGTAHGVFAHPFLDKGF